MGKVDSDIEIMGFEDSSVWLGHLDQCISQIMAVSMTDCKAISLVLKSSTQFVREDLSIELDEVQDTNEQE